MNDFWVTIKPGNNKPRLYYHCPVPGCGRVMTWKAAFATHVKYCKAKYEDRQLIEQRRSSSKV